MTRNYRDKTRIRLHRVGYVVICVLGVIFIGLIGYTPVANQPVVNDTSKTVEISRCASDPAELKPGQKGTMQVSRASRERCRVERMNEAGYFCLQLTGIYPPPVLYVSHGITTEC